MQQQQPQPSILQQQLPKPYVLFILPTDRPSSLAIQLANSLFHLIEIQNVQNMPIRPSWLTGVPLLLHLTKKIIYCGQNAIETLKQIKDMEPSGINGKGNNRNHSATGYAVTDSFNGPLGENVLSSQPAPISSQELMDHQNFTAASTDDEHRYSDGKKGKIIEDEVQRYASLRDQRLSAIRPAGSATTAPTVMPKWLQPEKP